MNSIVIAGTDSFAAMCDNVAFSLSLYSGQMCTAPQDIFVPRDGIDTDEGHKSFDEVAAGLAAAVDALLADPVRAAGVCGAIANPATLDRVAEARGLGRVVRDSTALAEGRTATPLIVAVDAADEAAYGEERFGPITFVVAVDDADDGHRPGGRPRPAPRRDHRGAVRHRRGAHPARRGRLRGGGRQPLGEPDRRHLRKPERRLQRLSRHRPQSRRQCQPDRRRLRRQPLPAGDVAPAQSRLTKKQPLGRNPMKALTTTALATLTTLGLAGVASAEIKIGATLSETGPAAFLGDPEAKTLKMLVEKANAAGGINGEQIELVLYDDGGDPNKARTFATRLVEDDEVAAIIGGTTTGTTMSIIPVAEDAEIPFISLAGAVEIIDPVKEWVFKTPHTDRMACEKIFGDMKARGITKIGMISGTDGFGASMRKQCLDVVGTFGIEVLADESYGPTDADMTPQLTNIKNTAGVEAVLNAGFGQGPSIVTRNFQQLAVGLPLYQSHGVASKSFIDLAGAGAAEGVRLPGAALLVADLLPADDPQKPVVEAYTKAFTETYNEPVSTFGGHAYDAFQILTQAIARAGSAEPEAIRDAIETTSGLVGTGGVVTMSPEDHLGLDLSAFRMLEIKDGNWTLVQ